MRIARPRAPVAPESPAVSHLQTYSQLQIMSTRPMVPVSWPPTPSEPKEAYLPHQGDRRAGPSLKDYNYESVWGQRALKATYRAIMEEEVPPVPPPACRPRADSTLPEVLRHTSAPHCAPKDRRLLERPACLTSWSCPAACPNRCRTA